MQTIRIDGRTIAYKDIGRGPAVILAHCSSGSHKQWKPLAARLSQRYRVLVPDLIGYGRSDPWPAGRQLEPQEEVNVILRMAEIAAGPVHLGGHSYGAAVMLEASRQLGSSVKSLTLVEPVAFHLLRLAHRAAEWQEITSVGHGVIDDLARGRVRSATAGYMGFWIGRLRWWLMPSRARQTVVRSIAKVAAEFAMLERLPASLADYYALKTPTRLIVGERTRRPARVVTEVLLALMPNAHQRTVPGAGHMSPFTHRETVERMMSEHILGLGGSEESEGHHDAAA